MSMFDLDKKHLEKLRRKKRHEIIDAYLTHDNLKRDLLELDLKTIEEQERLLCSTYKK